jgi:hypothetical protein
VRERLLDVGERSWSNDTLMRAPPFFSARVLRRAVDERRDRVLARSGGRVVRLPAELVERELAVAVGRVPEKLAGFSVRVRGDV